MSFSYDFSKVKDTAFELIEPGWYPFRIIEAEEGKSKNYNPMIKVVASCLDPRYRGKEIWHWVVFLPEDKKGSGMAKHFVKSIGLPADTKETISSQTWIGKSFMGKVMVSEYDGKKNNKFESISPIKPTETIAKPQEEDENPFAGE